MRFFVCSGCDAKFTEEDQTKSDYRDGKCPFCKSDDIKEQIPDAERASVCTSRLSLVYKPAIDWDEVRKAKIRCRTCLNYDQANLGCRFWLIPEERCPQRIESKRLDKARARV